MNVQTVHSDSRGEAYQNPRHCNEDPLFVATTSEYTSECYKDLNEFAVVGRRIFFGWKGTYWKPY